MGQQYKSLQTRDIEFIKQQKLFYIASCADSEVNLSPKGYDTLRVLNQDRLLFASYPGSGNRTFRDASAGGKFTLLFNAYEGAPQIVRVFCKATIISKDHEKYQDYLKMYNMRESLIRNIFEFNIYAVESSCGMSIPIMRYQEERNALKEWAQDMDSRDQLDAYNRAHHIPPDLGTV
jgi:hypothetical protein